MHADSEIKRYGEHHNALGFLRLVFASLVVVAHTPELIDGDRSREILTRLFGTISFGDLAVNCFFLISGYLIVGSFVKQPEIWGYLTRRVARIYPGFLFVSLLCVFVVAPLGGGALPSSPSAIIDMLKLMILLQPPAASGAFAGTHWPLLNGSMWTIAYEFRCYLLVILFGCLGLWRRPLLVAALAAVLFMTYLSASKAFWDTLGINTVPGWWAVVGRLSETLRFTGIFMTGSLFYLWRDRINYTAWKTMIAAAGLLASLFVPRFADVGTAVFGGYVVFAVASFGARNILGRINNENDISYGVYLYAWPIEKLILWYVPATFPLAAGMSTLMLSFLCGWASWHLLEKPVMRMVTRHRKRRAERLRPNETEDGQTPARHTF